MSEYAVEKRETAAEKLLCWRLPNSAGNGDCGCGY